MFCSLNFETLLNNSLCILLPIQTVSSWKIDLVKLELVPLGEGLEFDSYVKILDSKAVVLVAKVHFAQPQGQGHWDHMVSRFERKLVS